VLNVKAARLCVALASLALPVIGGTVSAPAADGAQLTPPGCSTAVASAPLLNNVPTHFVSGPAAPFGAAVSPDSRHVFVADASGRLFVYSMSLASLHSQVVGSYPQQSLVGLALTPDGRYLIAAQGTGATVFDAHQLEQGKSHSSSWVVTTLHSEGQGAIEVATSPDGHYAFVSLENSRELAVFHLRVGSAPGGSSNPVGYVRLGVAPVGIAVSPGGRYLYVTSEVAGPVGSGGSQGTITTIDLKKAEVSPSRSVVSTVPAGCSPVRVVATQSSVFVSARGSDQVLEFSAPALVKQPSTALRSSVQVGEAPVGLALVNHNRALVVADSNRFGSSGAQANLGVIAIGPDGVLTLRGYVPMGVFPRDMAVSPDGKTLVVSNFGSGQVETVDVRQLP